MAKSKKKALSWEAVIKHKKEICLAMAVAGITDDEGKVKSKETFRRNGGSDNPYRWHTPVQDILSYDNFEDLPIVWPKLIAEYAKPFIDGLTKRDAPRLRAEYISRWYERRNHRIRVDQKEREIQRRRVARGEPTLSDLYRGGEHYDVGRHPIFQQHQFYISYLRKRLKDPKFAKNFVSKYVILPKSNNTRSLASDRLYIQHPLSTKLQKIMEKRGLILFGPTFQLDVLCSISPLSFSKDNFYSYIEKKVKRRKHYKVPDEFRLIKYHGKLHIVLF